MIEWILTSSLLIVLVIILRHCLKGKIVLRLQYGLWAIVLVRLLVPISFGESGFSVLSVLNRVPGYVVDRLEAVSDYPLGYVGYETPDLAITEPDMGRGQLSEEEQEILQERNQKQWREEMEAARAKTGQAITVSGVLYGIWIGGILVVATCLIWSNLRFARRLKKSRQRVDAKKDIEDSTMKENGTQGGICTVPIYVTSVIETPCMFGLFAPAIYVTRDIMGNETMLSHVLAHETTHYRHRDHIWSALRSLCLIIHWYNPLVWIAALLSRRDAELACDEDTIRSIGEEMRIEYGRTLIGLTCGKKRPVEILDGEDEEEFRALQKCEGWQDGWGNLEDMPVPVHRYEVKDVEAVLQKYLGVSLQDLEDVKQQGMNFGKDSLYYLEEYDAFYNTTSDMGGGSFTCARGEIQGDKVYLYSKCSQYSESYGTVVVLKKQNDRYIIESHLRYGDFLNEAALEKAMKQLAETWKSKG